MKTINREDFTAEVNAEGYMIKYKGQTLGGAGIIGKSKSRGEARMGDLKNYRETADREMDNLANGIGRPDMLETIKTINSTPCTN